MDCNCFKREGKNCIQIVPIFNSLSSEEMVEIANITSEASFEKGQRIYMQGDKGDKLYVIHSGRVKISRITESGKEQVIRILSSGDFMGELSLFSSMPLMDNAEVLSNTVMCVIDGEKLKTLMKKYPEITFKIMEELSTRLEKAENAIENISIHGVEKRIADALLELKNEKDEVKLSMSKRDLASYLGMSQETLSRKLGFFQDKGWIKLVGHRRIILLDITSLSNIL